MSFSSQVKDEISNHTDGARHCRLAELTAITSFYGSYMPRRGGKLFLIYQTEHFHVMRKAYTLIRRLFHILPDVSVMRSRQWKEGCLYTLAIQDDEAVKGMLSEMGLLRKGALVDLSLPLSDILPGNDCCKRAFLRGVFLCRGVMNDPQKSYHFEIALDSEERARDVQELLSDVGITARTVVRKNQHVVYIKDAEQISDTLGTLGATAHMLEFENVRVLKDISGRINRQVNCETANLGKTVNAAAAQVRQIELIKDRKGLGSLPDDLKEAALLRLDNPDLPIADLGQMLTPPLGKSGIYHRFERIKKIAEELERES